MTHMLLHAVNPHWKHLFSQGVVYLIEGNAQTGFSVVQPGNSRRYPVGAIGAWKTGEMRKLKSWDGAMEALHLGYMYFVNLDESWFVDENNAIRNTLHGEWHNKDCPRRSNPKSIEVQGVQVKHTFLTKQKSPVMQLLKQYIKLKATDKAGILGKRADIVIPDETNSGAHGSYYSVPVEKPLSKNQPAYIAECNDIIEALDMNFAEGNGFKAIWRKAAARMGNGKEDSNPLYDAQKVQWSGDRLVIQES